MKAFNNASNISAQTLVSENTILSYVGRVNYDYKGRYLLSGSIRRDGLSVWAPGKKWATFPAASIGWRIDQEEFMSQVKSISELKVRAGYGVAGLNGTVLGNTPWSVAVNGNSAYYPFNNVGTAGAASSIPGLGNANLNWEKTKQFNIGVDLGLLRNKFTMSLEYYQRTTDNLILNVPLPYSFGYVNTTVPINIAGVTNTGFEAQLGYNGKAGDLKWNASVTLSVITNKVDHLAEGVTNIEAGLDADYGGYNITNTAPGHAVQSFYGWKTEGIFQNAAEVAGHATQVAGAKGTAPGDLKFQDMNKDGVIDDKDRVFLGSFIPKLTYAFNAWRQLQEFRFKLFLPGCFRATKFTMPHVLLRKE